MKTVTLIKTNILWIFFLLVIVYFSYFLFSNINQLESSQEGFIGIYFHQLYRPYYRQAKQQYNSQANYWTQSLNTALTNYRRFFLFG